MDLAPFHSGILLSESARWKNVVVATHCLAPATVALSQCPEICERASEIMKWISKEHGLTPVGDAIVNNHSMSFISDCLLLDYE